MFKLRTILTYSQSIYSQPLVVLAVCWASSSSSAYRNVQPEATTFLRDSVESIPPHVYEKTAAYTVDDVFGTKSLPLRNAVESAPVNL